MLDEGNYQMQNAIALYKEWGNKARIEELEERFPGQDGPRNTVTISDNTTEGLSFSPDDMHSNSQSAAQAPSEISSRTYRV